MSRNVQLQVLRGIRANMPTLGAGEMYLATDTMELYIGASGNKRVGISSVLASGGSGSANVKGPNAWVSGPATPSTVKAFAQINIAGTVYWVPLFQ